MWLLRYTKLPSLADTIGGEKEITLKTAPRSNVSGASKEAMDHVRGLDPDYHEGFVLQWTEDVVTCAKPEGFLKNLQMRSGVEPLRSNDLICPICDQPLTMGQIMTGDIIRKNGNIAHAGCCTPELGDAIESNPTPSGKP